MCERERTKEPLLILMIRISMDDLLSSVISVDKIKYLFDFYAIKVIVVGGYGFFFVIVALDNSNCRDCFCMIIFILLWSFLLILYTSLSHIMYWSCCLSGIIRICIHRRWWYCWLVFKSIWSCVFILVFEVVVINELIRFFLFDSTSLVLIVVLNLEFFFLLLFNPWPNEFLSFQKISIDITYFFLYIYNRELFCFSCWLIILD